MATRHTRNAKLQPKYRYLSSGTRRVPELRISGVWLEASGFAMGRTVSIEVSEGRLIITPARHGRG
ncbi:SymE family type I addiction module toxin [Parapedobacter sp. GCM10030251]|uniref:SymE family type I addiction module toxin n=1 Tax=Parapedobacter sp. GCM10030251 TaxID=3273419 RepID=UPI00360CC3D7